VASVSYSGAALYDLEQISDYISSEFSNPKAALNTVNRIQDAIDNLAAFPLIGSTLSSVTDTDPDYRFLVCGNYPAFYRLCGDEVLIDRILYGKRDYMHILFGESLQENPSGDV